MGNKISGLFDLMVVLGIFAIPAVAGLSLRQQFDMADAQAVLATSIEDEIQNARQAAIQFYGARGYAWPPSPHDTSATQVAIGGAGAFLGGCGGGAFAADMSKSEIVEYALHLASFRSGIPMPDLPPASGVESQVMRFRIIADWFRGVVI